MEQKIAHPSAFIDQESCEILRKDAVKAEQIKDLHPDQLSLIYKKNWFKIFIPERYGGLGWTLPEVLRTEEALSYADGSAGWVVTLCAGAGWFVGFLPPELVTEIISVDKLCIAGSGAVTGTADLTADGYVVSGTWRYASGSLHATAFTANCFIRQNGVRQLEEDGSPMVRAFLFHKDEVVLQRHWNSMGMVSTASHSFEVKELPVPVQRCFAIDSKRIFLEDPVYRYPFLQLAETTLSVNLAGMAMRFLDLCDPLFSDRMDRKKTSQEESMDLRQLLLEKRMELNQLRSDFYSAVDSSWSVCAAGEVFDPGLLSHVSKSSLSLARRSLQLVDALYPYCGLVAANTDTEINRVWRNIHTASQHALFSTA